MYLVHSRLSFLQATVYSTSPAKSAEIGALGNITVFTPAMAAVDSSSEASTETACIPASNKGGGPGEAAPLIRLIGTNAGLADSRNALMRRWIKMVSFDIKNHFSFNKFDTLIYKRLRRWSHISYFDWT